jgi:Domain of unknown function (DUF397)
MSWVKSSYSFSNGNCTEVDVVVVVAGPWRVVLVRDSKDPDGPVLRFGPGAWREFTTRTRKPG